MIEIFLAVAMIISLIALYKFLPNRKIFIYFCVSLIIVFAIAGLLARTQEPKESLNQEEISKIIRQQKIFSDWYNEYQKDIEQLDRNWQQYQNIIDNFKSNEIDEEIFFERLANLENEARIEQVHVYTLKVPSEIDEECRILIEEILKKIRRYSDAQIQTISLSKSLIDTEKFLNADHQQRVHQLENIIIRESPTGLFIAKELSAILKYFQLPEEVKK